MYPYKVFLGMDLYSIFLLVGVIACMILIRVLSDHRHMKASWQNLVLFNTVAAVILGYGSAGLFQAFYNYKASGTFEVVNSTGATFYGGLIGGAVLFIVVYFVAGHLLYKDGYHKKHFRMVSDMAAPCIAIAHGFGRLGCLMAGCCHGAKTDAWYGIFMDIPKDNTHEMVKVVPVQLYEAIFLFSLGALTCLLFWWGKKYLMPFYMVMYGFWRYFAENLRNDYRGSIGVEGWSPSQLISVVLLVGGVALFAVEYWVDRKAVANASTSDEADTDETATEEENDTSDEATS